MTPRRIPSDLNVTTVAGLDSPELARPLADMAAIMNVAEKRYGVRLYALTMHPRTLAAICKTAEARDVESYFVERGLSFTKTERDFVRLVNARFWGNPEAGAFTVTLDARIEPGVIELREVHPGETGIEARMRCGPLPAEVT